MTKKDFQLIAATIAELCVIIGNKEERAYQRTSIAEQFASALATTNPLFKRELFIQAATGQVAVAARKVREPSTPDEFIASASDVPGYNSPSARLLRGITEKSARRTGAPAIAERRNA